MTTQQATTNTTPPPVLAEGPGWKLIYKRFDDGKAYPFFEVSQPDGQAIWYTPEAIAERLAWWDSVVSAL